MLDLKKYSLMTLIYNAWNGGETLDDFFNPNSEELGLCSNISEDFFSNYHDVLTAIGVNCESLKNVNMNNYKKFRHELFSVDSSFREKYDKELDLIRDGLDESEEIDLLGIN